MRGDEQNPHHLRKDVCFDVSLNLPKLRSFVLKFIFNEGRLKTDR